MGKGGGKASQQGCPSVHPSVQDDSAHHEGMEPQGFACSHALAAEYPQLPSPSLSPGGPCPGLIPLRGPPLGATALGKREEGEKQAEGKGSKKCSRSISTQGCKRRRAEAQGTPHLHSSILCLGTGTGTVKDMQRPGLQSPSAGEGHAPDGHILHAGTGRCLWETQGAGMAQPSAPPAYDDKNPLYPPPPAGYPQPPHYGGYPQPGGYHPHPGGYPAAGGYAQPGGYPAAGGYPQPGMAMPTMPMRFGDDGMGDGSPFQSADWDDRKVRHTFIRKVYAIISLQLLVTVGIIAVFTFVHPVRSFVQRNVAIYYASYAVFLVTYLVLACCQGPRRRFPWNIILLSIFTLAMGLMTGTIASMYQTSAVLIAMLITAIVAIIVTIFCFQTKVDFTSCPGLFCVLGIVVMVTGIVTAIVLSFKYVPWLHMLYAAIGAIAFTLFLAYDTQLVLGNRKNTLSPEEYIYGALTIYTDIIYIFTFILQIVGRD